MRWSQFWGIFFYRRCCNFSFSGLKTSAHTLITRIAMEGTLYYTYRCSTVISIIFERVHVVSVHVHVHVHVSVCVCVCACACACSHACVCVCVCVCVHMGVPAIYFHPQRTGVAPHLCLDVKTLLHLSRRLCVAISSHALTELSVT